MSERSESCEKGEKWKEIRRLVSHLSLVSHNTYAERH